MSLFIEIFCVFQQKIGFIWFYHIRELIIEDITNSTDYLLSLQLVMRKIIVLRSRVKGKTISSRNDNANFNDFFTPLHARTKSVRILVRIHFIHQGQNPDIDMTSWKAVRSEDQSKSRRLHRPSWFRRFAGQEKQASHGIQNEPCPRIQERCDVSQREEEEKIIVELAKAQFIVYLE
ncbi:hypothetical protein ACFFRR_005274 [Megaselia abdita]